MRLLVRVAAAIASMRAPVKPLSANSWVATAKISAMVRAGSLVRPTSLAGSVVDGLDASKCTKWFISQV